MKKLILVLALLPAMAQSATLEQCRSLANDISFINAVDSQCMSATDRKRRFDGGMEVFYNSGCTNVVTKSEFSLAIDRDIINIDNIVKDLKKGIKFCKQKDVLTTYKDATNEIISFDK
ncbi:hypothetical protein UFOVP136_32 [uncultured Caudovirales phage]|uniref:Uncharacterized protein n=1 Tax=uncultured Caudovirales phage TaxID=2100421 RepID=A0A6J5LKC8_9CAUD|nr:hypothetical protein UFOVP136_32 [uncultured Caudovirales phage]